MELGAAEGFGLENFDPVGAWRTTENGLAIDASGVLPDGRRFDGPLELVEIVRSGDTFVRHLTQELLVYLLRRGPHPSDRATIDALLAQLDPERPALSGIVRGILSCEAFARRSPPR